MTLNPPVAFIVFNRPDLTRRSFEAVRSAAPKELFIIADGPRPDRPAQKQLCEETRSIVDAVDWNCTVHRNYALVNLGARVRVSSGLDWVFDQVPEAIILEDDCVAHPDFFGFCAALLDRYRSDERVAAIRGNNFQDGATRGDGSYFFSRYLRPWGWATWARTWALYDRDLTDWQIWRNEQLWRQRFPDEVERRTWERTLEGNLAHEVDAWDQRLFAGIWRQGGLTAVPNVNLVSNVGFGASATHTKDDWSAAAGRPTQPIGELTHPAAVVRDEEADRYFFDNQLGGRALRLRSRPLGFVRWLGGAILRRLNPRWLVRRFRG